jgi:hypothetical protein
MLLEQAKIIELHSTSGDRVETAAARDAYPGLGLDGGLAAELAGAPELLSLDAPIWCGLAAEIGYVP